MRSEVQDRGFPRGGGSRRDWSSQVSGGWERRMGKGKSNSRVGGRMRVMGDGGGRRDHVEDDEKKWKR